VQIFAGYDRSELIGSSIKTLQRDLLEEAVIVSVVIIIFLFHFRSALIPILALPIAVVASFIPMYLLHVSSNIMSLGGLALAIGVLVDAAIVMVENGYRHLSEPPTQLEPTSTVGAEHVTYEERVETTQRPVGTERNRRRILIDAARQVGPALFFSLLIIISAYLPLFTLERVERRLFTPMAFTVCYALLGSMLLALTLIPVLATYLFRNGATGWENPVLVWVQRGYERALRFALGRPLMTVVAAALVVIAAFGIGRLLGTEFLPQLDEGTIWVRANLPAGISLEKSAQVASTIRSILRRTVPPGTSDGTARRSPGSSSTRRGLRVKTAIPATNTWRRPHRSPTLLPRSRRPPKTRV